MTQTGGLGGYTPTPFDKSAGSQTPIEVPPGYEPPITHGPGEHNPASVEPYYTHGERVAPASEMGPFAQPTTSLGGMVSGHTYMEGDQWGPAHERMPDIKALQLQLIKAGLLDPTKVHMGIWDLNSADAYKLVLAQANIYGAKAPDMLDALTQNAPTDATNAGAAGARPTNPLDILQTVSTLNGPNVAQQLTGANLPENQSHAFLKWYQDQEAQARDAYSKADLTKGGALPANAPSLDAAAQEYLKQHNLGQVIAYGTASRMLEFQQMLGAL